MTGRIFFKKGVLETKNLKIGDSGKNRVRWDARLSLADPENPKFKTSVAAWEISAAGFGDIFGDVFYKGVSGEMRKFMAEVQGQGKTWKEIALTLNGKVSLRLENGTVHNGRLLNGIQKLFGLSTDPQEVVNRLLEPDKFYKEIAGDFVLVGGRAHTENFVYDEARKKISLVGQFDLGNNTMDIVVGVAPMNRDSGPFRGKRMTGGGRAHVRARLFMPTLVAIRYNPKLKAFYQRLLANGKSKMTAIVAVMRKLLVFLNTMLKNNQLWNENLV